MLITRTALASVLLLTLITDVSAQQPSPPAPSIGLPLPPIGLPLPPLGLSPAAETTSSQPPTTPPPVPPGVVIIGAVPYAWGFEQWQRSPVPGVVAVEPEVAAAPSSPRAAETETGRLQIEVRPRDAQLFVDDAFMGTWTDLSGAIDLPSGTHRVQIRARGYAKHDFEARIIAGRTITYRAELTPERPRTPTSRADAPSAPDAPDARSVPSAPSAPRTFYLIPGCYLGNIPPEEVKLPAGCDLSRVITHTPKQ